MLPPGGKRKSKRLMMTLKYESTNPNNCFSFSFSHVFSFDSLNFEVALTELGGVLLHVVPIMHVADGERNSDCR